MTTASLDRQHWLKRGIFLEAGLIAWNTIEGIIALAAGLLASSVALIGFGIDSMIEVTSAVVVLRRLYRERAGQSAEEVQQGERQAARIAGGLLLILAIYIVGDAGWRLLGYGAKPEKSLLGIVLTAVSLVVMPVWGWAKLHAAQKLNSRSLRADAFETITCAWLSLTTLAGLILNWAFEWAWADPLAALLIVPLIVREGLEGLKGEMYCDHKA